MARTSRNGAPNANVQALDNLDLDDMFADGGDDLFDGLDIDLGNMDDIAANNAQQQQQQNQQNETRSRPSAAAPAAAAAPAPAPEEEVPKRRKTKRKTTAPAFFDDNDDDFVEEPVKKKRRASKPATSKKRGSKKVAAVQEDAKVAAPPAASTKKSKAKTTMPPPSAKVSTTAGVAGQRKKSITVRNAKAVEKASAKAAPAPSVAASKVAKAQAGKTQAGKTQTPKVAVAQQAPSHPGLNQGSFCGLSPSNSLFYPFMPSLPQEVALKNRKIYSLLDRLHSSFTSQMTSSSKPTNGIVPVRPTEAVVQLMQEAFKEEKSSELSEQSKSEIIGGAIANGRRTVEFFEKSKLSHDLLAVCAQLQRQHEFLKQNAANMEKWCKNNMAEEEYADVYLPGRPKRKSDQGEPQVVLKPSILAPLSGATIRVKLVCTGFKVPKTVLQATLPGPSPAPDTKKAAKAPKKKKTAQEDSKPLAGAAPVPAVAQPIAYAQLRPAKRRKAVSELVSRAACALESEHLRRIEQRRQSIVAREKRARDAANDQSYQVAHTAGMWKWLEEMGYCEDRIDEAALRDRLEDARSLNWGEMQGVGDTEQPANNDEAGEDLSLRTNSEPPTSYVENLFDLLVDENDCSDAGGEDDDDDESKSNENGFEIGESSFAEGTLLAEMSGLSKEEATYLQLRSVGLSNLDWVPPVGSSTPSTAAAPATATAEAANVVEEPSSVQNATRRKEDGLQRSVSAEDDDDIEALIVSMKLDLARTSAQNSRRATYLETVSRATLETPKENKRRQETESGLNARHASLVKRTKEAKVKNGKLKSTKNDDLALPW